MTQENESATLKENWISFSIGPVQGFIEAARTVRDLWSGSYLLSWLTACAMAEAVKGGAELSTPAFKDNPLVMHLIGNGPEAKRIDSGKDPRLSSCLPNTFTATFNGDKEAAERLAASVEEEVRKEWREIADSVKGHLRKQWGSEESWNPDDGWKTQVETYWEIHTSVLPRGTDIDAAATRFNIKAEAKSGEEKKHAIARSLLGILGAAQKMVRHYPPAAPDEDTRPKCFLFGSDARMGPIAFRANDEFWQNAATKANSEGERLQPRDRFGAVALVKRFAWSQYFSKELGSRPREKRSWDTATIAAAGWIRGLGRAQNEWLHEEFNNTPDPWSGQWLHWKEPDPWRNGRGNIQRDEDACPPEVWRQLQMRKANASKRSLGAPPPYYALLMLDGDNMGDLFRNADKATAEKASGLLQRFALEVVPSTIREYLGGAEGIDIGQPIYAGGDDVMAMLPLWMLPSDAHANENEDLPITATVLQCAADINAAFVDTMREITGWQAHTSAGLVIAHYKQTLREVLEEARAAEKKAKNAGRNRLAIAVMRRSGEHSTALVPWGDCIDVLDGLIRAFQRGTLTDRWAYQLKAELDRETLTSVDMIDTEVARLLSRSEKRKSDPELFKTWKDLCEASSGDALDQARNAVELVMAASFIARGREE